MSFAGCQTISVVLSPAPAPYNRIIIVIVQVHNVLPAGGGGLYVTSTGIESVLSSSH